MKTYFIHEGNLDRFEKQMHQIERKCKKYGNDFRYSVLGEDFRKVKGSDEILHLTRFIEVEVEGSLKFDNWVFVAVVEHTEKGNIIRQYDTNQKVPEVYYYSDTTCEHCNTKRRRKDTFLIYNAESDVWKQVGRSCLKEFTSGLDAETVARWISSWDTIIEYESVPSGYSFTKYYNLRDILLYSAGCISKFGYFKSDSMYSTSSRTLDYYQADNEGHLVSDRKLEDVRKEMETVKFYAYSSDNQKLVDAAIEWLSSQPDDDQYIHNLKVACSGEYITGREFGLVCSLIRAYQRTLEIKDKQKKQEEEDSKSNHIGSVGDKITFEVSEFKCLSSEYTQFGPQYFYKFLDNRGNVYTWSTGTYISEESMPFQLTGKVKAHNEFRGCKQTQLTRCKVVAPSALQVANQTYNRDVEFALNEFLADLS